MNMLSALRGHLGKKAPPPGLRVLVTGSRRYRDLALVRTFVEALPPDATVISGGASGPDSMAVNTARRLGLAVEVYTPDYEAYGGRDAPLIRNDAMVASRPDFCMAFWDGSSRGTKYTFERVRRAGIPLRVITP